MSVLGSIKKMVGLAGSEREDSNSPTTVRIILEGVEGDRIVREERVNAFPVDEIRLGDHVPEKLIRESSLLRLKKHRDCLNAKDPCSQIDCLQHELST